MKTLSIKDSLFLKSILRKRTFLETVNKKITSHNVRAEMQIKYYDTAKS